MNGKEMNGLSVSAAVTSSMTQAQCWSTSASSPGSRRMIFRIDAVHVWIMNWSDRMHATIIQISEHPVDEDDYVSWGDLPEWFLNKMDYVDEIEPKHGLQRCISLGSFPGLSFDPETRKFKVISKSEYFSSAYGKFKEYLDKLKDMSFEEFIGNDVNVNMILLNSAYNDEYDCYVVDDDCYMYTLDEWIRDDNKGGYIGNVLDYHY